jgi:hypothetical protein
LTDNQRRAIARRKSQRDVPEVLADIERRLDSYSP